MKTSEISLEGLFRDEDMDQFGKLTVDGKEYRILTWQFFMLRKYWKNIAKLEGSVAEIIDEAARWEKMRER